MTLLIHYFPEEFRRQSENIPDMLLYAIPTAQRLFDRRTHGEKESQ